MGLLGRGVVSRRTAQVGGELHRVVARQLADAVLWQRGHAVDELGPLELGEARRVEVGRDGVQVDARCRS